MEKRCTFAAEILSNRMKAILKSMCLLFVMCLTACQETSDVTASQNAHSIYEKALAVLDHDSVQAGEQLLYEAMSIARKEKDLHSLYLAQLRLAESLAWGNSQEALDMAKEALKTYERCQDSERNHILILDYIGTYASQLAFNNEGSFDEALSYTRQAYALAEASRDTLGTDLLCQTLTSLANIHWAMEDYDAALRYARAAEACTPEELLLGTQQVLARCLMSCDSLAAAEAIYRQMQPGEDLQAAYIVQSNLAKLALRRSDIDAAEEAIDEAFEHAEDLYFKALGHKDDYYQASLLQERENERLRYASKLHWRMFWGALLLFLIIIGAAAIILRLRLRAKAQRQQQEERLREQELAAQREQLRQRDATIAFLQNFILERSEVIKKLDETAERHIAIPPHEWEEIERTLNAIDGDRIARLRERFPSLKEDDLQLCILTCLRLSNRAIGNIYGVSISAVQHRKLRIKKEIFGETNPNITFEQVIEKI